MARKKAPPGSLQKQKLRRPFIEEWRNYRDLTQEQLAERVAELLETSMTGATISRIEAAKSPYSQRQLEAIAKILQCEPADLIMRDPTDTEAPWSIWDQAQIGDKRKIVDMMRVITGKAGNGG